MATSVGFPIPFFSNQLVPLSGSIRISIKNYNINNRLAIKNILYKKQNYIIKQNGSIKK